MSHERTMNFIEQRVADRRMLRFIQKLLKAGVSEYFFFFNDTATTEIYTLSHTTLFRSQEPGIVRIVVARSARGAEKLGKGNFESLRSEEHTSELQSLRHLVCRLLLE